MKREKVLKLCKVCGKSLLDIGVGALSRIAAKKFGCQVTSIDVNRYRLEIEKEKVLKEGLEDKIILELQDATNLPYSDGSFQIVISYGALHHTPVEQRAIFLIETFRVASEKLCITEFRKSTFPHFELEKVDLHWLQKKLKCMGRTEVYRGRKMNLYICLKKRLFQNTI